jgi:TonB family protein
MRRRMVYEMNTATIRTDWVGRCIDGRFTLLQWLGGSESGGVFLTELQGSPSQKATIKLIPADATDAEAHIAGWAVTTTLSHPHLMRLFHTGRCQIDNTGLLYAVTEYAEEVLSQILPERPLAPPEAREMLDPVLDALSYLHGKGLVHGHLKPSNIMVVDNQLKLSSDRLHVAGEVGNHFPASNIYDAPEAATEPIFPAADVWSLGVTLVEALTQHPPVWDRSTHREPIVPQSIPQPFAEITKECLRFDPSRRWTLGDVKACLEAARSLPDPASKTRRAVPAKLRLTALVAAVLILIVAVAALLLRSNRVKPGFTAGEKLVVNISAPAPQSPVQETQTTKGEEVKGAVAGRVMPDVLRSASKTIQGKVEVRIRVTVDPSGNVSNATFDSPGPSKYFAKLALQAAQQWRFKPPKVDGQAVSSVWILQFQFTQTATLVAPSQASP